jgi:methyl-accepting chemotaxis protein
MSSDSQYLSRLRAVGDRLLLGVIAVLMLASLGLAGWYGTWVEAFAIGLPAAIIPAWLVSSNPGALVTRCAIAASLVIFTALQIHQAHGLLELHFGFFVLLAFLLFYRDWVPLVVAAGLIAVHHLAFDFIQRSGGHVWVFAANTGFSIVLIHAAYVVFETALLVWMAVILRAEAEAVGCEPDELARVSQELAKGNVTAKVPVGAAGPNSLARAMATMRDQLQATVHDTSAVLQAVAAGDLSKRVTVDAPGEFGRLKDHVNQTVDFLASLTQTQSRLIQRASVGDFSERCPTTGLAGYQLEFAQGLNQLVASIDSLLERFAEVLGGIAKGDLTRRISQSYTGRLEDLSRATNATAEQLASIVSGIQTAAKAIQSASSGIAAGNTELSARTEEQASSLGQIVSSIGELSTAVKKNAESALRASHLSHDATQSAVKGGVEIAQVVSNMDGISESSRKIADIIGVIQDIAFQTNLLALNAAVEAARAGEQGKGFAVVASEVRGLAGRSATAAKEIRELIADSVRRVEAGATLVSQTRATMEEIVDSIGRVKEVVSEISAESHNQSTGIASVGRATEVMDQVTQQNAALVEEAAAAAQSMTDEAESLAKSVEVFKLRERGTPQFTTVPRAAARA